MAGFQLTVVTRLNFPLNNEDVDMRNMLLMRLGRLYKCEYRGQDNLFDAVYDQLIVPDHVCRSFLRGYMLNYMDLEWDDVEVKSSIYILLIYINWQISHKTKL